MQSLGLVWEAPHPSSKAKKRAHLPVPWARPPGQPSPPVKQIMQICWQMDPRDAHLGWRHTAGPTQHAMCLGSLWICKGMWHLAISKLEMSTEVWMSSPLRSSQKVDGCRAADCRTALHAIQSREQFLEGPPCPGTAWSQPVAFPSGPSSPVGLLPVLRGWQWLLT